MKHLTPAEGEKICRDAVATYGREKQEWVFVGEVGELLDAVADFKRGRCGKDHVAEEIADVAVMLQQMTIVFCCEDELDEALEFKLVRLKERLENSGRTE